MTTRAVTPSGTEPLVTTITQTLHVEFDREYRSDFPAAAGRRPLVRHAAQP